MLLGFPIQTAKLNAMELALMPDFAKSFESKLYEENCITNKIIIQHYEEYKEKHPEKWAAMELKYMGRYKNGNLKRYTFTDARVREMVRHIRLGPWPRDLVGTGKGYYRDPTKNGRVKYFLSIEQRAKANGDIGLAFFEGLWKDGMLNPEQIKDIYRCEAKLYSAYTELTGILESIIE